MNHTVRLAIILCACWLLLSGMMEPLMLTFGIISVLITLWLTTRMVKIDRERYTFFVTFSFLNFLFKLGIKIVQSNIDVTLRILGLKPVESTFVSIKVPYADHVSIVTYANAITLTPGSASVALDKGTLLIHTISKQGANDLLEGDMLKVMPSQYTVHSVENEQ